MYIAANKNIHNARDEYRFRDNLRVELAKALSHEAKPLKSSAHAHTKIWSILNGNICKKILNRTPVKHVVGELNSDVTSIIQTEIDCKPLRTTQKMY
jgi:hypothetical protein